MAKVAFSKLKCKISDEVKVINFNDISIEIKQYLPIQEKLKMISEIIVDSYEEDNNYLNPLKIKTFFEVKLIEFYTNINFTEKQLEDIPKLYDMVVCSGLMEMVKNNLPSDDYKNLYQDLLNSAESIYKYQTSILGIMNAISSKPNTIASLENELGNVEGDLKELVESPMIKDLLFALGQQGLINN